MSKTKKARETEQNLQLTLAKQLDEWAALEKKLTPIRKQQAELESSIRALATKFATDESGQPVSQQLEATQAMVVVSVVTKRKILPDKFFDLVKQSKRTPDFWACVSIHESKAEKFAGADISNITTTEQSTRVALRLK